MTMLMKYVYRLVFPSGLVQDLETGLKAQEGDLLSSEQLGITEEPTGKWLIRRIEEIDPGEYPHVIAYHLERF